MLFKPCYKAPVPEHAARSKEKGVLYASWKNKHGKRLKLQVRIDANGHEYCNVPVQNFYAKYKDSAGRLVIRNTECTQKDAAQSKLNTWRGITEKVKAGHLRSEAEQAKKHGPMLFKDVQAEYVEALRRGWNKRRQVARPASESHLYYVEHVLTAFRDGRNIHRLIDLTPKAVQKHLDDLQDKGKSARTRNYHRAILSGFSNYCYFHDYLPDNPVEKASIADVEQDKRRTPRALTEKELARLLAAAESRPLDSFFLKNTGPVDMDNVDPETIERRKIAGRQHRLVYLTLVNTGLRWGELRRVCVRDVMLKAAAPHIRLSAENTKGKRDDIVPLVDSLVKELHAWIVDTGRIGASPLFDMPEGGILVFDRDIKAAKIPKETKDGRACVHSLRHTAATRMARAGVPVAILKDIMRHSDIKTTMKYYTHLTAIDMHNAVQSLPPIPEDGIEDENQDGKSAT